MRSRIKRLCAGARARRILSGFMALSLVLTALYAGPLSVAAETRVVGGEGLSDGASALPAEGVSSGCDVKVVIVDKLSRYAVKP